MSKKTRALLALAVVCCISTAAGGMSAALGKTTPARTEPIAKGSAYVCPIGRNPYDIHGWIHVTKWCIVPGVRDQVQVKLQMKIHNSSRTHYLDIGQDNFRLIVRHFDEARWTPAEIGSPTLAQPIHTTYHGEGVWAIPADAEEAYDTIRHEPNNLTFATHWYGTSLAPGATFEPHFHYGDLVFYLPRSHHLSPLQNIVGIAFIHGSDILALCEPDVWQEHAYAGTF